MLVLSLLEIQIMVVPNDNVYCSGYIDLHFLNWLHTCI